MSSKNWSDGSSKCEEMVRNSTPQQMRLAMTASIARMRKQVAEVRP
jgi:hypothetical protein